jgi:hypothetical protein
MSSSHENPVSLDTGVVHLSSSEELYTSFSPDFLDSDLVMVEPLKIAVTTAV